MLPDGLALVDQTQGLLAFSLGFKDVFQRNRGRSFSQEVPCPLGEFACQVLAIPISSFAVSLGYLGQLVDDVPRKLTAARLSDKFDGVAASLDEALPFLRSASLSLE